eukprot:5965347-Amphidinium_carterae.1
MLFASQRQVPIGLNQGYRLLLLLLPSLMRSMKQQQIGTFFQAKKFFVDNNIKVHIPAGKDIDITPLAGFQVSQLGMTGVAEHVMHEK